MRFRCLAIALAFLAAMASDSWGQSKQPTPPPAQGAQTNQASKPYERGTEQSPVIVKMLPTKESEEKAAADTRREDEKTANDRQLTRFTELLFWATGALSIIALFQLLVFGWQGIQLKRSVTAAKEASELGNREFVATHRPRVILRYIDGPYYNDEGHQFIAIPFVNIGANDAIIDAFGGDLAYRGGFNEAWQIPGLDADLKDIQPITLVCGQRHVFTVTAKASFKTDTLVAKSAWPGFQTCAVGILRYRDGNGISRHTGFFRVLDDDGMRFVVSQHDSEMEYQD